MDDLCLQAVPSRVAAWHNQHPLAYRISAEQVQAVGYLALPADELIAPLSPRRVARWAKRHGRVMAQGAVAASATNQQVYVMSATIELGGLRTKVLMGASNAVIGPRLWSGPRVAAGGAAAMLLMATVLALSWLRPLAPHHDVVAVAPIHKPVVMAAASASAPAVAVAHLPDAPAAAVAAPVEAPVEAQPQSGRVQLPALSAMISDEAKAAARAQRQSRVPLTPVVAPVQATDAAPNKATVPNAARSFALSTRPLRTRAEAEQVQAAMSALLRSGTAGKLSKVQTDILPQGEDWRVVGMPFAQREAAEQARRLLITRGMRVEVVAF